MCLCDVTKIKHEGNIVCYKVLERNKDRYFSPIKDHEWEVGKIYLADFVFGVDEDNMVSEHTIGPGAFHVFTDLSDAKFYCSRIKKVRESEDFCVAECVIPEGNRYLYKGYVYTGGLFLLGYASERLKVVKIVKE